MWRRGDDAAAQAQAAAGHGAMAETAYRKVTSGQDQHSEHQPTGQCVRAAAVATGLLLMLFAQHGTPDFFRRKPEVFAGDRSLVADK